jgi:hypothetical protein
MGLTYTFSSSDTGAPSLTNAAGCVIGILDAILVNGYNSKTVTITRSGTTATINCTSHNFVDGRILLIAGANESDYNGEFRCTYIDANNVSIQVANSPATPATGTITAKVAPIGWTKPYSSTNIAAYKQKAGTNQMYLWVSDTTTSDARFRGYEVMTAHSTGTGPFPTDAQLSGGNYCPKSADATARPWKAYSNGKIFYFIFNNTITALPLNNSGSGIFFGDAISHKPSDAYFTVCIGSSSAGGIGSSGYINSSVTSVTSSSNGHYCARAMSGTGASIPIGKMCGLVANASSYIGSFSYVNNYPDPITGGLLLHKAYLVEGSATGVCGYRGVLPGVWGWGHSDQYAAGDTFSGAAGTYLEGRKFEMQSNYSNSRFVFETSDTWSA